MKKITIRVLSAALLVAALFSLASCASRKSAMSVSEFRGIMTQNGFSVQDSTEQYNSPLVSESYIAIDSTQSYQIEFIVAPDNNSAQQIFNQTKAAAESSKSSGSSETSSNIGASARYTLTSGGTYYLLSKIDNTFVYLRADASYKGEINEIIKKLGY